MKTSTARIYFVSSAKASGAIREYRNLQEILIKTDSLYESTRVEFQYVATLKNHNLRIVKENL